MRIFLNRLRGLLGRLLYYGKRLRVLLFRWAASLEAWYFGGTFVFPMSCGLAVPLRVNGRGRVLIGDRASLGYDKAPIIGSGEILLQARERDAVIEIGSRTTTSNNISLIAVDSIRIGEGCQIGDNVWLGSRVLVLKGVHIGNDSVIAAGSVVTKSIPARCIAGGVTAKVIRTI